MEHNHIVPGIAHFLIQRFGGASYEADGLGHVEIFGPGKARRLPVQHIHSLPEPFSEGQVRMEIRKEPLGLPVMDKHQESRMFPVFRHGDQMGHMFFSPLRGGVRKHGAPFAGKAAGFHFHREGFPGVRIPQKQVKPAVSHGHLPACEEIVFPSRDFPVLHQVRRHVVGLRGVQVENVLPLFYAHHPVRRAEPQPVRRQVQCDPGKEEFPHPSGIGHVAGFRLAMDKDMAHKPVRPVYECALNDFFINRFQRWLLSGLKPDRRSPIQGEALSGPAVPKRMSYDLTSCDRAGAASY